MNFDAFKREIATHPPSVCLILGKETEEAVACAVKGWSGILTWDAETFQAEAFLQEVETLPFLKKHVYLHVKEVDRIKDLRVVQTYVSRPSRWVSLLLSGTTLPATHPLVKATSSQGIVLRVPDVKPWERESRLADALVHRAAEEGVTLLPEAGRALVTHLGYEREILHQELEKLICFVGKRRQITVQDVAQISTYLPHETLWQLGDALLMRDRALALTVMRHIIEEGVSPFALLANLRSQLRTAFEIVIHYQQGGEAAVRTAFPYLKGGLAQKKIKAATAMGARRLRQALVHIFDCEVQAKNSSLPLPHLLDVLIAKF